LLGRLRVWGLVGAGDAGEDERGFEEGENYTDGAIGSREIGHGSRIRWT